MLICMTLLLMAFSLACWMMGNGPLAAVAGMGACGLTADVGRRLLGAGGAGRSHGGESEEAQARPPFAIPQPTEPGIDTTSGSDIGASEVR